MHVLRETWAGQLVFLGWGAPPSPLHWDGFPAIPEGIGWRRRFLGQEWVSWRRPRGACSVLFGTLVNCWVTSRCCISMTYYWISVGYVYHKKGRVFTPAEKGIPWRCFQTMYDHVLHLHSAIFIVPYNTLLTQQQLQYQTLSSLKPAPGRFLFPFCEASDGHIQRSKHQIHAVGSS